MNSCPQLPVGQQCNSTALCLSGCFTDFLGKAQLVKHKPPYPTEIPKTIILAALFSDCWILWCSCCPFAGSSTSTFSWPSRRLIQISHLPLLNLCACFLPYSPWHSGKPPRSHLWNQCVGLARKTDRRTAIPFLTFYIMVDLATAPYNH